MFRLAFCRICLLWCDSVSLIISSFYEMSLLTYWNGRFGERWFYAQKNSKKRENHLLIKLDLSLNFSLIVLCFNFCLIVISYIIWLVCLNSYTNIKETSISRSVERDALTFWEAKHQCFSFYFVFLSSHATFFTVKYIYLELVQLQSDFYIEH